MIPIPKYFFYSVLRNKTILHKSSESEGSELQAAGDKQSPHRLEEGWATGNHMAQSEGRRSWSFQDLGVTEVTWLTRVSNLICINTVYSSHAAV